MGQGREAGTRSDRKHSVLCDRAHWGVVPLTKMRDTGGGADMEIGGE